MLLDVDFRKEMQSKVKVKLKTKKMKQKKELHLREYLRYSNSDVRNQI